MNEIAEQVKIVEDLERSWASRRKNEVTETTEAGDAFISLIWEHGPLKIEVWAIINARGTMTEQVLAVDSSVTRSVLDKLVIWQRVAGDGFFLPLYEMRSQKRKNAAKPIDLCRAEMHQLLERVLKNPEGLTRSLRNRALETGESVATVSGGLPSLGWSSR